MLEVLCKMVHTTDRVKLSVHQFSDITVITYDVFDGSFPIVRALHYISFNLAAGNLECLIVQHTREIVSKSDIYDL
jgi:hypothetical protein